MKAILKTFVLFVVNLEVILKLLELNLRSIFRKITIFGNISIIYVTNLMKNKIKERLFNF